MARLGPFQLIEPLGEGGMGTVWRARHRGGAAVAVKVLHPRPEAKAGLEKEVHAIARLDHPHVVRVLDFGTLAEEADTAAPGAAWIAMELIDGATLTERRGRVRWAELQAVLSCLLDALAHAHARGVVHLDLKPANVLAGRDGRLRLTDFGIARFLGESDARSAGSFGTPPYMAPELWARSWARVGPAADLYALGCLAWSLVTGWGPFREKSAADYARAHVGAALPPLRPLAEMPRGLEPWLRHLLSKEPTARPRCAADAAWGLRHVGQAARPVAMLGPIDVDPDGPTLKDAEHTALAHLDEAPLAPVDEPGASVDRRAPFPATWRGYVPPPQPLVIGGIGLGLFGVRTVPFVGREDERDLLWSALRRVDGDRRMHAVALDGEGGVGKARLAGWLVERAAEIGAARAVSWTDADLTTGASSLLERRADALERLRVLAADRVVILVLDELDDNPLCAALIPDLLRAQDVLPVPALVLAMSRSGRPLPGAERLPIPALPAHEHTALLRAMLGFDGPLLGTLAEWTAGNPGFAVDLVADLVRRRLLVPARRGFTLADGAKLTLPSGTTSMWAPALDGLPDADRIALQLAAVLGHRVSSERWRDACRALGAPPSPGLIGEAARRRLVEHVEDGFVFRHPAVRRLLVEAARSEGHLSGLHRACASVEPDPGRRGHHLLEAGEATLALSALFVGARRRAEESAFDVAERHLEAWMEAATRARLTLDDPRFGAVDVLRSQLLRAQGDVDGATAAARAAWRGGRRGGWLAVRARAAQQLGYSAMFRARPARAIAWLRIASSLGRFAALRKVRMQAVRAWAETLARTGRLGAAEEVLRRALAEAAEAGTSSVDLAQVLSAILKQRGALAEARRLREETRAAIEATGDRWQLANLANDLADIARLRGDPLEAERGFRAALQEFRALGAIMVVIPLMNLGLLLASSERWGEARAVLGDVLALTERRGLRDLAGGAHVWLAACAAALADRPGLELHLDRAGALLTETGFVDIDNARGLELAATAAARAGMDRLADRAARLATTQRPGAAP